MKKLLSSLTQVIRRRTIFSRLLMMFILATLLPLLLFSAWSYRYSSRLIREKIFVSYHEMLNQISGELNQKLKKIRNDSIEISYLTEIQDVLANYEKKSSRELNLSKIEIAKEMSRKYAFDNIVSGIILYTKDLQRMDIYGVETSNYDLKQDYLVDFIDEIRSQNGRCVFRAANRNDQIEKSFLGNGCAILVGKAVKEPKTGEILGYMITQVDELHLSDIFRDVAYSLGARIFILNEEGMVISASGQDSGQIGELFEPEEERVTLLTSPVTEDFFYSARFGNKPTELLSNALDYSAWNVFFLAPQSQMSAQLTTSVASLLRICLVCMLLGIAVTFVFTSSILHPLSQVVDGMEAFEKGNLTVVLDEQGSDEITRLASQFNKMTKEINLLLETEKNNENQKRILEIQALQAQINPHFLSNTLNTVSSIAQIRGEDTIRELVNAIIELLRDSMKNDDSLHPVSEELNQVRNYITIQDYRLLGKFTMETDVDPLILSCLMPRFTLQPIIENAIIHGIEPLKKRGTILLRGYQSEEMLIFEVTDNGQGMTVQQINRVLQESNEERHRFSGMGIKNVNERIRLLMGKEYGLSIISEVGSFTTVKVILPLIKQTHAGSRQTEDEMEDEIGTPVSGVISEEKQFIEEK